MAFLHVYNSLYLRGGWLSQISVQVYGTVAYKKGAADKSEYGSFSPLMEGVGEPVGTVEGAVDALANF